MLYSRRISDVKRIVLYGEPSSKTLDLGRIKDYLKENIPTAQVSVEDNFFVYCLGRAPEDRKEHFIEGIGSRMAVSRVKNPMKRIFSDQPMYGEVQYEKGMIKDPSHKAVGVVYDGLKLHTLFHEMLLEAAKAKIEEGNAQKTGAAAEEAGGEIHIVFTNRLFGTFDDMDRRYHARTIICGCPSIISTIGIIEAPAKPKEFYILKQKYSAAGADSDMMLEILKREFRGRFIDYDDERLTDVLKGYAMQAVFYNLAMEPFCSDKNCVLYNAHWQEELIQAQIGSGKLCERHQAMLKGGA